MRAGGRPAPGGEEGKVRCPAPWWGRGEGVIIVGCPAPSWGRGEGAVRAGGRPAPWWGKGEDVVRGEPRMQVSWTMVTRALGSPLALSVLCRATDYGLLSQSIIVCRQTVDLF